MSYTPYRSARALGDLRGTGGDTPSLCLELSTCGSVCLAMHFALTAREDDETATREV